MRANGSPRGAPILAWAVVLISVALIALGWIWYGFSLEIQDRMWRDILDRAGGPMSFRFILQPMMAFIAAIHDGLKDARTGREAYFWAILNDPAARGGRLREGLISTARIILLGLGMDAIYQYRVLHTFYPGEALLITLILAVVPYLLMRGPVDRVARWWLARTRNASPATGRKGDA